MVRNQLPMQWLRNQAEVSRYKYFIIEKLKSIDEVNFQLKSLYYLFIIKVNYRANVNLLRWNDARRQFFVPEILIFSQFLSVVEYNPGKIE